MTNHSQQIVQKLWNYCNVLRDDGLSYGDYLEQLTFLLFLKMADEQRQAAVQPAVADPARATTGPSLLDRWTATSSRRTTATRWRSSAKQAGMLGLIFRKAQNKIQDPAKLRRLIVDLIGKEQWLEPRRRREGRRLRGPAREERRRTSRAARASTSRRGR